MANAKIEKRDGKLLFSSPFSGTFFQYGWYRTIHLWGARVFVPFLGDFLSMQAMKDNNISDCGFRPLSWGLSFNWQSLKITWCLALACFRPLSWGLSFNYTALWDILRQIPERFRPLSWGLSFNWVVW
ncbi:MAG: hypothetical protein SO025_03625 [Dialister sp.]|nr:hypothetical protein [Dialister sp.]